MHSHLIGSTGMDQESYVAQDNVLNSNAGHGSQPYHSDTWVDMSTSAYHHPTTMPEFASGFAYMPPLGHGLSGLPSESLNRMPPPPPPQPVPQPQATPQQLPGLIMPSHPTWPSMLTNPNTPYTPHSAPAITMAPVPVPLKASKVPTLHTPSTPRKMLTDDDRRRMCQYAEDHPNVKQTEIGAMFGVERSTVSKVLRNKEKYLFPEDRSNSPIKRNKPKGVDIEKALGNYVRNLQKQGQAITDSDITEKARLFASTARDAAETYLKTTNSSWLEKFKQKHGIAHPGKLLRRASETNIPDSIRHHSPSLTPLSAISPASPSAHPSPSPLSGTRSEDDKEGLSHFMDYTTDGAYKHSNSQSNTSLSSAFTDAAASSFSGSALSPSGAPFTFSPDPNVGGFLTAADQGSREIPHTAASSNFQRPRSQTFPTLNLDYVNDQQGGSNGAEPATPRIHMPATAPSSALDSPANELAAAPPFGMDSAITPSSSSPHLIRRSSSNGSLATGRSANTPAPQSAVGSSPSSPTQEDARRAADTLLSFISNNVAGLALDQNEYMAVVRLTEKLRLHQNQGQLGGGALGGNGGGGGVTGLGVQQGGMGGLSRIPEGDSEMTNAPGVMPSQVEQGISA